MSDNIYAQHWDHFAKTRKREGAYWPGDEWGSPEAWDRLFSNLFVARGGVSNWRNCVEIGAGSGKYTIKVLEASQASIVAADVSSVYQDVFCQRMSEAGLISRVSPILLDNDSSTLYRAIMERKLNGGLDGFYSIDAMVHVDLQYLIAYLVTAAVCLKVGGKLIMTLANCCSDRGFEKLIAETKNSFARIGKHSGKFEWLSPDAVTSILPRLGFDIDILQTTGRDIALVASLRAPLSDPKIIQCIKT